MSLDTTLSISTTDSEATRKLGQRIGQLLNPGMAIELVGDVGSGKTTLVQGIAAGLGFEGSVTSPTFTLDRTYTTPKAVLHHFDLYRLQGHDIVTEEFEEAAADPQAITVIEWAGRGKAQLPSDRLQIVIGGSADPDQRVLKLEPLGPQSGRLMRRLRHDS